MVQGSTAARRLFTGDDVEPWTYADEPRCEGDVVWNDDVSAWLVFSHQLCKQMGRGDNVDWQNGHVPSEDRPVPLGLDREDFVENMGGGGRHVITFLEGEEHSKVHRWMRSM